MNRASDCAQQVSVRCDFVSYDTLKLLMETTQSFHIMNNLALQGQGALYFRAEHRYRLQHIFPAAFRMI